MMFIKICGITTAEDACAAVECGASAVGFVFWPESPRYLEPDPARAIIATPPAAVARGRRLLLAGGLTPENVAEAIAQVRPFGIDVSSGVEVRPGVKDRGRLEALFDAMR